MTCGALIYGFVIKADDITQMPQVDSYRDRNGRTVLVDNDDVHPIEWAMEHHKYGKYVYVEDVDFWYSDKVIIGCFIGWSGDELTLEDMENVKKYAADISEAIKFFTGWDTDISDYGYHVCTMYDWNFYSYLSKLN